MASHADAAALVAPRAVQAPVDPAALDGEVVCVDLEAIRAQRHAWGVFRDRRPDLYGPLLTLDGDGAF